MPFLSNDFIDSNRYFSYLENQRNWSDFFVILIPIIGNIAACFFSSKNSNWDDQDFVMEKVLAHGLNLEHASRRLKGNRDIVFAATNQNVEAFKFADNAVKEDYEFALECFLRHCDKIHSFRFFPEKIKCNKDFITQAIELMGPNGAHDYIPIQLALPLTKDRDFMLFMISKNKEYFDVIDPTLWQDESFILDAICKNRKILQNEFFTEHRKDKDFVIKVVTRDGLALQHIEWALRYDIGVISAAVSANGLALKFAFTNDIKLIKMAIEQNPEAIEYAQLLDNQHQRLLNNDHDLFIEICSKSLFTFAEASDELKKDPEFVGEVIRRNGLALLYADDQFKSDIEYINLALETAPNIFNRLDLSSFSQEQVERMALKVAENEYVFPIYQNLPELLKENKDLILALVAKNYQELEHVQDSFKNDEDIILAGFIGNPRAILFASEQIKRDQDFIFGLLRQKLQATYDISDELKNDKAFMLRVIDLDPTLSRFASNDLKKDRAFASAAIKKDGMNIAYFDFREDRELVLEALKQNPLALKYLDFRFKINKPLVLDCVRRNGLALEFASFNLRRDLEVVKAAITQNPEAIEFASKALREQLIVQV
jgi:hypothetical protein